MPSIRADARSDWSTRSDMTHSDTLGCRCPRQSHLLFKHGCKPCLVQCHLRMVKCATCGHDATPSMECKSYSRNGVILLVRKGYVKKILPAMRSEPYMVRISTCSSNVPVQQLAGSLMRIPSTMQITANQQLKNTKQGVGESGGILCKKL